MGPWHCLKHTQPQCLSIQLVGPQGGGYLWLFWARKCSCFCYLKLHNISVNMFEKGGGERLVLSLSVQQNTLLHVVPDGSRLWSVSLNQPTVTTPPPPPQKPNLNSEIVSSYLTQCSCLESLNDIGSNWREDEVEIEQNAQKIFPGTCWSWRQDWIADSYLTRKELLSITRGRLQVSNYANYAIPISVWSAL